MQWNRFDIMEAFYCYACDYHNGMWSKEYAIFGRINNMGGRVSPVLSYETLGENAQMIYDALACGELKVRDVHAPRA